MSYNWQVEKKLLAQLHELEKRKIAWENLVEQAEGTMERAKELVSKSESFNKIEKEKKKKAIELSEHAREGNGSAVNVETEAFQAQSESKCAAKVPTSTAGMNVVLDDSVIVEESFKIKHSALRGMSFPVTDVV
jgi:predicted nucleotidyltransferase